jgi:hypothetical protein
MRWATLASVRRQDTGRLIDAGAQTMPESEKQNELELEDLPESEQELTDAQAAEVVGGAASRFQLSDPLAPRALICWLTQPAGDELINPG